jgi:hypothetical protein
MRRSNVLFALLALAACSGAPGPTDASTPSDAGSNLWPVGATRVNATEGAGFGPIGCNDGGFNALETLWSLSLPDGALTRTQCGAVTVDRTLTASELARFDTAMRALALPTQQGCGADKGTLTLALTTPDGPRRYVDSFYACNKEPGVIYVDNIDPVFTALNSFPP